MNFVQAIRSVFVNYFNFSGRASRSEYWLFYLFLIIADIAVDIADTLIFGDAEFAPINLIFFLGVLIPTVAVSVRRLHDIDRTGWWGLLLLTVVGLLVLLYWNLKPGDEGENRFGNNPLTLDGWETEPKQTGRRYQRCHRYLPHFCRHFGRDDFCLNRSNNLQRILVAL